MLPAQLVRSTGLISHLNALRQEWLALAIAATRSIRWRSKRQTACWAGTDVGPLGVGYASTIRVTRSTETEYVSSFTTLLER